MPSLLWNWNNQNDLKQKKSPARNWLVQSLVVFFYCVTFIIINAQNTSYANHNTNNNCFFLFIAIKRFVCISLRSLHGKTAQNAISVHKNRLSADCDKRRQIDFLVNLNLFVTHENHHFPFKWNGFSSNTYDNHIVDLKMPPSYSS